MVSNPAAKYQTGDRPKLVVIEICFRRTTFGLADQLGHQIVTGSAAQLVQMCVQPEVEAGDPALHPPVLRPGQPEIQAGRGKLTELENALTIVVRHSQDVADDRHRKLGAVSVDDVDDARLARKLIQQRLRGLFDPVP